MNELNDVLDAFNKQWMDDYNGWQKDYFPQFKQKNTSDKIQQNPLKDKEFFFESYGRQNIKRYFQALKYKKRSGDDIYGMDCNACCAMYFLQNYGLIPHTMTRKDFECIFTPLKPNFDEHITVPQHNKNESREKTPTEIIVDGNVLKMKENIFDGIFTNTMDFLRGRNDNGGGAIIPGTTDGQKKLYQIFERFEKLVVEKDYQFLTNYTKYGIHDLRYSNLINVYEELRVGEGSYYDDYFDKHTIFIGIGNYKDPQPSHYCLIVNPPIDITVDGIDFWLYPTDDPLTGGTFTFVPRESGYDLVKYQRYKNIVKKYNDNNGLNYRIIYLNFATGVTNKT